ncbi:Putative protein of unknown function [Podospora comata]|uniref:Mitochondrial adapter protein MCP1 transmembrane domain-containing protein n=2 Tax=Podospora TaxID=5144 RepID=A0ABY6RZR5_PODCO|nr:Putative protein of unknown function [Podospora comata]
MEYHTLRSRASQDTLVSNASTSLSLLELDPTPMDSPASVPYTDKDLPPLPEQPEESLSDSTHSLRSNPTTTSSVGLSGAGHGPIFYLTRIQRYSSYTFSLFTTLHLATTSVIPVLARSVPASESYLLLAREIYQTPLSEPLLVALPVVVHIGAGIATRLIRRSQNLKRYYGDDHHHRKGSVPAKQTPTLRSGWPTFSYIAASGYGFTAIFAAHAFMNRGLPLLVEGDSANIGLAFVAHGFAKHPVISWTSFVSLIGLGVGHMVWGWAKWVGAAQGAGWQLERHTGNAAVDKQTKKKRRRRLLVINGVAAIGCVMWAAGGLGIVARGGETLGWVGKLYDGLYEKVPGLF